MIKVSGLMGWLRFFFLFLVEFFLSFIIQYLIDFELDFIIFFYLLFIEFNQSHYLSHGFGGLTRVFLCLFFHHFFFNFIIQYWNNWKLSFIICFDLLFIRLSSSHNPSCSFDKATYVDLNCFFFNSSFKILGWELNFIIYFDLFSMKLSQSHDPGCGIDRLTWIDLNRFRGCLRVWLLLLFVPKYIKMMFFYFLKIIFEISTSKRSKTYKKNIFLRTLNMFSS